MSVAYETCETAWCPGCGNFAILECLKAALTELGKKPCEVVLMCTGSQGEPSSILGRLAAGTNRQFDLVAGDTVVLSSRPIPGNEESVHRTINRLFRRGANVISGAVAPVHVSGHASQEEMKLLLNLVKPKHFIPIHGELRHLHAHARLARQLGIAEEDIFIVEDGAILEFTAHRGKVKKEKAPAGNVYVHGKGVGDVGRRVIAEREILGNNGFVLAIVPIHPKTGDITGKPELISRGFIFQPERGDLMDRAAAAVYNALKEGKVRQQQAVIDRAQGLLSRFFFEETKRKPMVLAVVTHRE